MIGKIDLPTRKRFNFIIGNIPKDAKKILDLACGEGYLHQILKRRFGKSVTGVDFKGYDYGFQYNKPDIYHDLNKYPYPFGKESFDCIIAGEIIEHVYSPYNFLKELNRILKKNGILIVTTPNACGVHHTFENPDKTEYKRPYGHIQFFTEACLRRLLGYMGFEFMKSGYNCYIKYLPFYWLNHRFGANMFVVARKK